MSTLTQRILAAIERLGGVITREQQTQLCREFGVRQINWMFGKPHYMERLADDSRVLVR